MPENDTVVDLAPEGQRYVENPDFVPDPTHQFGTLDTSGTAGAAHARIEEVTPIFDIADAENAKQAARALDPDDKEVDSSLVVMPQGSPMTVVDEDAIKERLAKKAEGTEKVKVYGKTASQKDAAKSGKEGEEIAQAQQETQAGSAGSAVTGDPEGAERQSGGERQEQTSGAEEKKDEEKPKSGQRGR